MKEIKGVKFNQVLILYFSIIQCKLPWSIFHDICIVADVIFVAQIQSHSIFEREGNNLVMTVTVNLCEALCGAQVPVKTLDGRSFKVFNVHMVQPGYEKVLAGEGMPVLGEPGEIVNL